MWNYTALKNDLAGGFDSWLFFIYFLFSVADIVKEVTDDKGLEKAERKRLQIEHAPHASHRAKLVKLADKLYNLRDLRRVTPKGEATIAFKWLNICIYLDCLCEN